MTSVPAAGGPASDPAAAEQSEAERIAAAVADCPAVARLDSGRFGEVATYLPGRRVPGVAIREDAIEVSVVGSATATARELLAQVRGSVGPLLAGRRLDVAFADIELPDAAGRAAAPS